MCGIAGEVSLNRDVIVEDRFVKKMCESLSHRGPDEETYFYGGNVCLGARRLAVVGLTNGSQPFFNEMKEIISVYNGEIYNYKTLRDELIKDGYIFKSESDGEIIPYLYEKYGRNFVTYLRGMFAITIYDKRKEELILIRDKVGKKPLNYYYDNNTVYFSSELHSLIQHPKVTREINKEIIDTYLSYRIIPNPYTIYRNVYKVKPGSILTFSKDGVMECQYWSFSFEKDMENDQNEIVNELNNLLYGAVEDRLECDVDAGVLLSGGVDSSLITSMVQKVRENKRFHTFSISFEEENFNESYYANLMSDYCNTIHHNYVITPDDVVSIINKLLIHYGEPFAFPTAIACYFMNKIAKDYVTVNLTGDGADEIFAGYNRYKRFLKLYQLSSDNKNSQAIEELYYSILVDGVKDDIKNQIYSSSMKKNDYSSIHFLKNKFKDNASLQDPLLRVLDVDCNFWLCDAQLVKIDIASMANSIELRSPFLDSDFIDYATRITPSLKLNNQNEKYILKLLAQNYLPSTIIERAKKELAVPIEVWLTTYLREEIVSTLLSEEALNRGYFETEKYKLFVQNFTKYDSYAIWTLYILEKWHQVNKIAS